MRCLFALAVGLLLLAGSVLPGQDQPKPISLIQLIANPEKFDGKVVSVDGYLMIGEHPEFVGQQPILYLHEEDAKNLLLSNSVWVVPSDQMLRNRETLNHMYVTVTGVFRASRGEGGTITQVQNFAIWSDPGHPVGRKGDDRKYK